MTEHLPYFKAYDIRGIFPDQINIEVAYRIARAVAEWTGAKEIVLGRDARLSSPALAEAIIVWTGCWFEAINSFKARG
ncbi:MAG: hypothetical protein ACYDBV_11925 [Nitrospiria bacterium]